MATLAVIVLVGATSVWTWRYRQRQRYVAQLGSETRAGAQALADGDFTTALAHLTRARHAAQGLADDTPLEREALQLHREAQAWTQLAGATLDEFFAAAPADPSEWPAAEYTERFHRDLAGRVLVIDTDLELAPIEQLRGRPDGPTAEPMPRRLRLAWMYLGESYRVEIDLIDTGRFGALKSGHPRRAVFAAEMASIERTADDAERWLLRLDPDSVALLTTEAPLRGLGWPADPTLAEVLAAQRRQVGIEP